MLPITPHSYMAGATGVEPISLESESKVLPLNEAPILNGRDEGI